MAIRTNQCYLALGTDTGGSVRLPAAYTGLVGFKPSYGMLSRDGVVPYANSLDTVGILARSCLPAFLAFRKVPLISTITSELTSIELLSMPDANDPTCATESTRRRISKIKNERVVKSTQGPIRIVPLNSGQKYSKRDRPRWRRKIFPSMERSPTRRIGVPIEYNIEEMSDSVRLAWIETLSLLEALGHEIVPISLPSTKHALSAYYVLAPAEASSNLAKYDGVRYGARSAGVVDNVAQSLYSHTRGEFFGPEVKRRILLGAYSLSADAIDNYFIQAQKVRRLVQKDFDLVFRMKNPLHDHTVPPLDGVDYIVSPTAPTPPPKIHSLENASPIDAYMNDVFTVPASLAGLPAISVPALSSRSSEDESENFIGIQIIGQYGDDTSVMQFANSAIEEQKERYSARTQRLGRIIR